MNLPPLGRIGNEKPTGGGKNLFIASPQITLCLVVESLLRARLQRADSG